MTNRAVILEWQKHVLSEWLWFHGQRRPDTVIVADLDELEKLVKRGNLEDVKKLSRKLIRWADEGCDHTQCSDVRLYCAWALIRLGDDNSAHELFLQAKQNYVHDHDKAITLWLWGCLRSYQSGTKDYALRLMEDCSKYFKHLIDSYLNLLDHFNDSEDQEKQRRELSRVIGWYQDRYVETLLVIRYLKTKDQLLSPRELAFRMNATSKAP